MLHKLGNEKKNAKDILGRLKQCACWLREARAHATCEEVANMVGEMGTVAMGRDYRDPFNKLGFGCEVCVNLRSLNDWKHGF